MSENYQEIKLWKGLKIFDFGGPWPLTFESHKVDNVIFSIFDKVTSIPEILGLFTNVV